MNRWLAVALFGLGAVVATAEAAEPRDTPVLTDFSETDQLKEPGKEPTGELATAIEAALRTACGIDGTPTAPQSYKGKFMALSALQQIHYASCGTHPFKAKRVFVITKGIEIIGSGDAWNGKIVRHIEDIDDDGTDEVVLMNSTVGMGVTSHRARVVSYTDGVETTVGDFGLVYSSSDPASPDTCQERAAVIFLKTLDPSKMYRKDYHQPCGADKAWAEIGTVDLLLDQ